MKRLRLPSRWQLPRLEYLLLALLVLCWGTQFKASLYQAASHGRRVPVAKLLSDTEGSETMRTALAAPDVLAPTGFMGTFHATALPASLPELVLAAAVPFDSPHPDWQLLAQRDSLGHFFHRPPPTL